MDAAVFLAPTFPRCEGSTWPRWAPVSPPLPAGNANLLPGARLSKKACSGSEPSCNPLLSSQPLLPCCLPPPYPTGRKPFSLLFKRIYFIKHYF